MTKPEPFDEATAQWVYEIVANCEDRTYCGYSEFWCCKILGGITVHEERMCCTSHKDCPLFKESEQE